ncbi:FecR family protein [Pseudomonas putida]
MSQVDGVVIDEAAQWMALVKSGHASPEELQAFHRWCDLDPRHAEVVARMGGGLGRLPVEALRGMPRSSIVNSINSPSSRRQFLGKSVSVLGLGLLGVGLARFYGLFPEAGQVQTVTGERRSLSLADGSALTLNARTEVVVRFTPSERRVLLRSGEIMVDVARDPGRPFVVETEHGQMRALGTRFLVQSDSNATRIVMLHSQVQITTRAGLAQIVQAGQSAWFDRAGQLQVQVASGYEGAWLDGLLEVHDRPLSEVVAHLRDYRRGIIVLRPEIAELRLSGLYFLDDSDRTLQLLQRSLPISVRYHTPLWVTIEPRA